NVFDGSNGSFVKSIAVGGSEDTPTTHPDWSPDGKSIVFTHIGVAQNKTNGTTSFGYRSSLQLITQDDAGSWSAPAALSPSTEGQVYYYPTFSPDGTLLAFDHSQCADNKDGGECDMYDDAGATLFVMKPAKGAAHVALAVANAPGKGDTAASVENSYPK